MDGMLNSRLSTRLCKHEKENIVKNTRLTRVMNQFSWITVEVNVWFIIIISLFFSIAGETEAFSRARHKILLSATK